MSKQCNHVKKDGFHTCGSYSFNLWSEEGIEQGQLCDVHYWQDQAQNARADEREQGQRWFEAVTAQHKQLLLAEREACAKECKFDRSSADIEIAIRARGNKT